MLRNQRLRMWSTGEVIVMCSGLCPKRKYIYCRLRLFCQNICGLKVHVYDQLLCVFVTLMIFLIVSNFFPSIVSFCSDSVRKKYVKQKYVSVSGTGAPQIIQTNTYTQWRTLCSAPSNDKSKQNRKTNKLKTHGIPELNIQLMGFVSIVPRKHTPINR